MANKKENTVSLWGRLGVQIDMTPEEFEVLKKNDKTAKDLLVELIKSDRCYLSGESYFPPEANEELSDLDEYMEFDIGFQPLQSDEFEAMEQTLLEQRENPEIWALRGEISNLRHELDGALIYDPERAPKIEKCLAVRELELNAALEGVELNLDPDDIIDAEHLDCFWYDGYIGSIEYKGYVVEVKVVGDVRFSLFDENLEFLADFNNPTHEDILPYIKDDEILHNLIEDCRVIFSLNNQVKYVVHDKEDNVIKSIPYYNILGENVLEAFADVSVYKELIDKIVLANDKEVARNGAHSFLEDNIAAAKQMKKDITPDGISHKDITR